MHLLEVLKNPYGAAAYQAANEKKPGADNSGKFTKAQNLIKSNLLGNLKIGRAYTQIPVTKYKSHNTGDRSKGLTFHGTNVPKKGHISPLKGQSNIARPSLASKNSQPKTRVGHIVPARTFLEQTGRAGMARSDIAKQQLAALKPYYGKVKGGSKRNLGRKRSRSTIQFTNTGPLLVKRTNEAVNPAEIIPRRALHEIEAQEDFTRDNNNSYEFENGDGDSDSHEEEAMNNSLEKIAYEPRYKKEDDNYDRPQRRFKEESPRRRWEDDEEEEDHHHVHENATEHSSFEHRLTEKLLDAIISEHGRHESPSQNEHPNLG